MKDEIKREVAAIEKSYDNGQFLKAGTPEYKAWASSHRKAWNKYRNSWDTFKLNNHLIDIPHPRNFK